MVYPLANITSVFLGAQTDCSKKSQLLETNSPHGMEEEEEEEEDPSHQSHPRCEHHTCFLTTSR